MSSPHDHPPPSHSSPSSTTLIRLGFVPEQVNIPLMLCSERGLFSIHGIHASHQLIPQGTGRMLDMIEANEIDVAFTVTDAAMVARAKGRPIRIIGTFVESPLIWVAAVAPNSKCSSFLELKTSIGGARAMRVGISRMGSGSHTMATYASTIHDLGPMEFHVADNFEGLREAVRSGICDMFLWEKFTTKPWIDSGELASVGEVATPWTAFSIIALDDSNAATSNRAVLDELFAAISDGVRLFVTEIDESVKRIITEYRHTEKDARDWRCACRYAEGFLIDEERTQNSLDVLKKVGLIDKTVELRDVLGSMTKS